MTSIFDERGNKFIITISKKELEDAFKSFDNLQFLLHDICLTTYGKQMADELFPLGQKGIEQ